MKLLVILALVGAAAAAPQRAPQQPSGSQVQLLKYENENNIDSYNFGWVQDDGQRHSEEGQLKNQGTDEEALSVKGQYAWVGPDGVTYVVTYIADENGFQPTIEQGPGGGVPPAVVASLLG